MFIFIVIVSLLEIISILAYLSERQKNKDLCEEYEKEKCDLLIKHGKEIEDNIIIYTKIIDSVRSDNYTLRQQVKELENQLKRHEEIRNNVEGESDKYESFICITLLEMLNEYKSCKTPKEISQLIGETMEKILRNISK